MGQILHGSATTTHAIRFAEAGAAMSADPVGDRSKAVGDHGSAESGMTVFELAEILEIFRSLSPAGKRRVRLKWSRSRRRGK